MLPTTPATSPRWSRMRESAWVTFWATSKYKSTFFLFFCWRVKNSNFCLIKYTSYLCCVSNSYKSSYIIRIQVHIRNIEGGGKSKLRATNLLGDKILKIPKFLFPLTYLTWSMAMKIGSGAVLSDYYTTGTDCIIWLLHYWHRLYYLTITLLAPTNILLEMCWLCAIMDLSS